MMPASAPSFDRRDTEQALREQFRRSRLWVLGWTFARAMQCPLIVISLSRAIHARERREQAQQQQRQPRCPRQVSLL